MKANILIILVLAIAAMQISSVFLAYKDMAKLSYRLNRLECFEFTPQGENMRQHLEKCEEEYLR